MKRDIRDFKAWASEQALSLTPTDSADYDVENLAFLDEKLEGKRVAFLVEMNHFIHEKYDFRLLLIRYLVSRGWRFIGEELSWTDGVQVDRYLADGDASHLDRVTTYGYRDCVRADRNDEPTGILKDSADSYPQAELRAEQIRFAESLRRLNVNQPGSERLRFFGFDVDYTPGGGYEDLEEMLSPFVDDPVVKSVRDLLVRVPRETLEQEILRLSRGVRSIEENEKPLAELLGTKAYSRLLRSATTLRDSFDYIRIAHPAKNYEALNEAMAFREMVMHRQVEYVLNNLASDDKVILMAGSLHLMKDDRKVKAPGVGAGPGGGSLPSIGHFVSQNLAPDQVFSAWMLYDHGQDNQPFPDLPQDLTSIPGSLNAVLSEIGTDFMLPVSNDPQARLYQKTSDIVHMYNLVFKAKVAEQADAISFTRRVSPLKL
jgi:erythromycin esterase-like protein